VAVQPCRAQRQAGRCTGRRRSHFRLLFANRDGQIARLNFTLQPGTTRPELTRGELPGNPATPGDQFLRIRIQVDEEGKLRNSTVLESTDEDWLRRPWASSVHGGSSPRWRMASPSRWKASSS